MKIIALILVSVSLSAIAQLVLKLGMSGARVQSTLGGDSVVDSLMTVMTDGRVLLGLFIYGVGVILWLWVLSQTDLSFAYPFVGIGFILTMLFGAVFLSEPVGITRISGTLLIVAGVVLVSQS
jgi:multidrug transporter EmrE-like cation transporter